MDGRERVTRLLKRQPLDRVPVYEHFWEDTIKAWVTAGHVGPDETFEAHFDLDLMESYDTGWTFDLAVEAGFEPVVVEETDETQLLRDGNGALLRRHKLHDTTPEHVGFSITTPEAWAAVRPKLATVDESRIDFAGYRARRQQAAREGRFYLWSGLHVFELMRPLVGDETLLMAFALEPEWVADMVSVLTDLLVSLQEILFAAEGWPDGIWYYEDLGFKGKPFMSPAMYAELLLPGHVRTFDFAHAHGLPVIMHSCGYMYPLLPALVGAGLDCLQVIEVKAGMDLLQIHREFGQKLALMGGMDARVLISNDLAAVDRELEAKLPAVKEGFGYCLHSDHSIPADVAYETYRHFLDRGRALGTY